MPAPRRARPSVTASTRTWWRVGPWFAENGWRAVAVDLRGHGASPRMQGDEGLDDLAADLHETVLEEPGTVDVLLGHSLGALVAMKPVESPRTGAAAGAEEPPGSSSTTSGRWRVRRWQALSLPGDLPKRRCSFSWLRTPPGPGRTRGTASPGCSTAARVRSPGFGTGCATTWRRWSAPSRYPPCSCSGARSTAPCCQPRARGRGWLAAAGTTKEFDAGHGVHRDDFEGYVRLLAGWLGEPELETSAGSSPGYPRRDGLEGGPLRGVVEGLQLEVVVHLRRAFRMSWSVSQGFFGSSEPCR